jgi:FkbM family methyltransferase
MYSRGFWEEKEIDFLMAEAEKARHAHALESWFLDVGANIGLYAVYFNAYGNFQKVIAFEPEQKNLIELRLNLQMNEASSVELLAVGLSDEDRTATLSTSKGTVSSTLENVLDSDNTQQITVKSFDQLYQPSGLLLIVKMDIEGHELQALRGMQTALTRNKVVLQVESFAQKLPGTDAFLRSIGFTRFETFGDDHYYRNF